MSARCRVCGCASCRRPCRGELSQDACAVIEYALRVTVMREEDATALLLATDATYVENAEDAARVNTMRQLVDVVAKARTIYVEF